MTNDNEGFEVLVRYKPLARAILEEITRTYGMGMHLYDWKESVLATHSRADAQRNEKSEERVLFAASLGEPSRAAAARLSLQLHVSGKVVLSMPLTALGAKPTLLSQPIHIGGTEPFFIRVVYTVDSAPYEGSLTVVWRTLQKGPYS